MKKRIYKYLLTGLLLTFSGLAVWLVNPFSNSTGQNQKAIYKKTPSHVPKADKPDEFIKLYNDLRTRAGKSKPGYTNGYKLAALDKARQSVAASRLSITYDFIERGPGNVPGRTRGLIVDPDDATHATWFAGGVGGGIWKTTDAGQTWVNKTDNLPNLAISWLVMAESDHNIIYAGTGEGWGGSVGFIKGSGIYKSSDKGETWTLLPSTAQNDDFQIVNRIVVDPVNPNIVLAATSNDALNAVSFNSGIFKSTDGGTTWTRKFSGQSWVQQIVSTPGDFNTLYATVRANGIFKSTDAGETWNNASFGLNPDGRVEMAISPVNTSRLYASVVGSLSGNESDLYISDDAGATWQVITEENTGSDVDFLGGQGWYDNTILAHPFDEDMVYVGGVNLWKFEIKPGTVTEDKQFLGAEEQNTSSFLDLVNFGATYYSGKISAGNETVENFVSVEVRFGPDGVGGHLNQMAHRFTIPVGQGSGVPADDYTYQDYVEVPFQVWDITNNRQLMVAFRDQQDDGIFNLLPLNTDNADAINNSREYIFMSSIDYNAAGPDPEMAVDGQHELKNLYFIWPHLADGGTWDEANLPASKFIITYESIEKRLKVTTSVADAYSEFGGNNSFSQSTGALTPQGVHPDHHNIVPIIWDQPTKSFQLLIANDGGVYKSNVNTIPGEANGSWEIAGLSYNTGQFYAVDKAPGESRYVGGLQDNGSWMSQPDEDGSATAIYQRASAGDGFGCAWNYGSPFKILTTVQFNDIRKSTDGGASFATSTSGLSDTGAEGSPFVSEIESISSDPDVVFTAGLSGVWRSVNFADAWTLSEITEQWSLASTMKVRISRANSHIIWAGTAMQETPSKISLHVSTDEGLSFSPVINYIDSELGRLSGLATHPILDSTAFALFSFAQGPKVLRTDNLGQSWYDISGFGSGTTSTNGFPDVALYDLLVMPYDTATIWAGTEIGIFESTDAGVSWHILNADMPATAIWDMKIVDNQVVIGTHGRGIWSVTIDDLPGQVYLPKIIAGNPSLAGELFLDISMQSVFDSTHLYLDGVLFAKLNQATGVGTLRIITNYTAPQTGVVYVRSFHNGVPYVSHTFDFELFNYNATVDSYENDFSIVSDDFFGDGFSETTPSGFTNKAIQSTHFYEPNTEYQYILKFPIKIKSANALINFNEVVLVEPGNTGSLPGTPEFNDFVVVQGSTDGINWINLLDEYDAGNRNDWESAFASGQSGDNDLYKFRSINLLDTYQSNDEVLIRFLLVANSSNEGWGWAIDNLRIQTDNVITGLDPEKTIIKYAVYPNPITENTVTIANPDGNKEGRVHLFNINGQMVLSKSLDLSGDTKLAIPLVFKDGIYTLVITTDNLTESHKVIIQRRL